MDFQDVVRRRRMVRNFAERPLDPAHVERILENARRGPSAGFSQGFEFLVLESREERDRFWTSQDPGAPLPRMYEDMRRAPLLVAALSHKQAYLDRYAEPDKGWTDKDEAHWPVPYWDIDAGMAALLMLLTAVDLGLGAVFFGIFDMAGFRAAFGVPDTHTAVGVVAVGHPAPDTKSPSLRRGRRPATDVVHRGRW
ncbi:MAG: nitroreductase family protein [Mycobacteriales bacterium]|nr:nitroreductase family protein [Frankia sp.]